MKITSYLFLLVLLVSCTSSENETISFNEAFQVEEGKSYVLGDATLESMQINQNYCPCDVQCITAGEAWVTFTHRLANGDTKMITVYEISTHLNPSWIEIDFLEVTDDCQPLVSKISLIANDRASFCDHEAIVNNSRYSNANNEIEINSAEIFGDCLMLNYSASGCDGSTWRLSLYDSGEIAESFPEQRFLAIDIDNQEACDAIIEREISFSLIDLRLGESGTVLFNLANFEDQLSYTY